MDGCSKAGNVRNVVTRHLDSRLRGPLAGAAARDKELYLSIWSWSEPSLAPACMLCIRAGNEPSRSTEKAHMTYDTMLNGH